MGSAWRKSNGTGSGCGKGGLGFSFGYGGGRGIVADGVILRISPIRRPISSRGKTMRKVNKGLLRLSKSLIIVSAIMLLCGSFVWASPLEKTLYSFSGGSAG